MPSVMTMEGAELGRHKGKRCKRVKMGKKRGCTIELCYVGKSRKHKSGWSFQKGTSRCGR